MAVTEQMISFHITNYKLVKQYLLEINNMKQQNTKKSSYGDSRNI